MPSPSIQGTSFHFWLDEPWDSHKTIAAPFDEEPFGRSIDLPGQAILVNLNSIPLIFHPIRQKRVGVEFEYIHYATIILLHQIPQRVVIICTTPR
jgi:hypothetical protein